MKAIYYSAGYKYQLRRDFSIQTEILGYYVNLKYIRLTKKGKLAGKCGYAWDGASGPTWDTKNSMRGSLVHDILYQMIRLGHIEKDHKEYADNLLHDLCTEDGMWPLRADYWRWAVLKFGAPSTMPSAEPPELVAP